MTNKRELELYFHIPFCVRKCLYCDFLSAPADGRIRVRYMDALIREAKERAGDYRDYRVVSVFIGGGTPTIVPPEQIARLLDTVREGYELEEDAEITIEANPGTVDEKTLQLYFQAGINRLSIGLQSADNRELAALGRIHTYGQFLGTYHMARKCGFSNINVDLMSALPGQTLPCWLGTLEKVLALEPPPEHISAYSLILEEGTPFYEMEQKGEIRLPDEDCDRTMYEKTKERLEWAGYHRYEISNYALPGYECRHNCGYWRRREYLGLGIGAASLIGNVRFRNGDSLEDYLDDPLGVREEVQELSLQEQMEEYMFLGLRMTEGVSVAGFREFFGVGMEDIYGDVIEKNLREGLLEYRKDAPADQKISCQAGLGQYSPEDGDKPCRNGNTGEEPGSCGGGNAGEEPGSCGGGNVGEEPGSCWSGNAGEEPDLCRGGNAEEESGLCRSGNMGEEPGLCRSGDLGRENQSVGQDNSALGGSQMNPAERRIAFTRRGIDVSNMVMAQFLL